jgi:hypothetical protein
MFSFECEQLGFHFDSFGHDLEVQGPAELDQGVHDGGRLGRSKQGGDEGLVDLQDLNRELAQVTQP